MPDAAETVGAVAAAQDIQKSIKRKRKINMKDPYILEDGTLKNLLGITDYEEFVVVSMM